MKLGKFIGQKTISLTKENIDKYIVPPSLGVNSGVVGALLLGAQALGHDF